MIVDNGIEELKPGHLWVKRSVNEGAIEYFTQKRSESVVQLNASCSTCCISNATGRVNEKVRRLKMLLLNVKAMILKTVLFYSQSVQLGSVIYPALICLSLQSILKIF